MKTAIDTLKDAAVQTEMNGAAWTILVHAAQYLDLQPEYFSRQGAIARRRAGYNRRRANARARHEAMLSCGLVRVRVNGKTFYE